MVKLFQYLLTTLGIPYRRNGHLNSDAEEHIVTPGEKTKVWQEKNVVKRIIARQSHPSGYPLYTSVGGYPAIRSLERGGNGSIYLGWHPSLNIPVAIKVIPLGINGRRQSTLASARREAMIAAKIDHPNIVRIYDCGEDENYGFYIVMECMGLKDLGSLLEQQKNGKFSVDLALFFIIEVTKALVKINNQNVIHRDVKPQNILLNMEGAVKLADLGLAKVRNRSLDLTQTGSSKGTPFYMAPEQADDAKHVDHSADIYGLGTTFYQFLTGNKPFQGSDPYQVTKLKKEGLYKAPNLLEPTLEERVCQIVEKMMATKPEDRYQTPDDLLQDLTDYQATRDTNGRSVLTSLTNALPADYPVPIPEFDVQSWKSQNGDNHGIMPEAGQERAEKPGAVTLQRHNGASRGFVVSLILLMISVSLVAGVYLYSTRPEAQDQQLRALVAAASQQARRIQDRFVPKCPVNNPFPEFTKQIDEILTSADHLFAQGSYTLAFQKYRELWQWIRELKLLDLQCSQCEIKRALHSETHRNP